MFLKKVIIHFFAVEISASEVKSSCGSDGIFTETEDEGFFGGPNKSTTNIGWLVGVAGNGHHHDDLTRKSAHIDIYEAGQAKPPPYLNVKEVQPAVEKTSSASAANSQIYYNLSRSKSVCDLSMEQNSQLLNCSEKSFTIERKRVIERKPNPEPEELKEDGSVQHQQTPHRSRVVRNRTILGSFPLFYKLSQSLSSLNTKSEISTQMGSDNCGAFYMDNTYSDR